MDVREFEQAVACHRAGDLDTAMRLYRQCLKAAPGHLEARRHLALLHLQVGQPAAALKELDRALKTEKDWPPALLEKGRVLAMTGRLREAATVFERVTEVTPGDADGVCFLGRARL